MTALAFVAACLTLLATPGPTNTLLATAGAEAGWRRSVHLLVAELLGYMLAITTLRFVLGPVIASRPEFAMAVNCAVGGLLIYLAVMLWRRGGQGLKIGGAVTFAHVLGTTFVNPKGLVFAFTILPIEPAVIELLPWLGALACQILIVGFGWILIGHSVSARFRNPSTARIGYRIGAGFMALLAALVVVRAVH